MKVIKFAYCGFVALLLACSGTSIEDDAKKAAELTAGSNRYAMENNMSGAGKAYQEAQEIMEKYKRQQRFEEFYPLYNQYLEEILTSGLPVEN